MLQRWNKLSHKTAGPSSQNCRAFIFHKNEQARCSSMAQV
jgi:hypothetical protein